MTQRLLASRLSGGRLLTEPCRSATMRTTESPRPTDLGTLWSMALSFQTCSDSLSMLQPRLACPVLAQGYPAEHPSICTRQRRLRQRHIRDRLTWECRTNVSHVMAVAARTGLACHRHLSTAPDASYLPRPTRACYSAQPPVRSHPMLTELNGEQVPQCEPINSEQAASLALA